MTPRTPLLLVLVLAACGAGPDPHQPPITGTDDDGSDPSTTGLPDAGNCDAFIGCALLCEPGDAECTLDCQNVTGADGAECTSRHCLDLIDQCGYDEPGACEELASFCDGTPDTTSTSTGTDSSSTSTDGSTTGEPVTPCDSYLGCVDACGWTDRCKDDCNATIDDVNVHDCEAQHCEDLEHDCPTDPAACTDLLEQCGPDTSDETSSSSSSSTT